MPSASSSKASVESDTVDTFEIVEHLDTLKLSPEKIFMAKVAKYEERACRYYDRGLERVGEHKLQIQGYFEEYKRTVEKFVTELSWRMENDWLIEPEYSEHIEPQYYKQHRLLAELYEILKDVGVGEDAKQLQKIMYHKALNLSMNTSHLSSNTIKERKVRPAIFDKEERESDDSAVCSEDEDAKRERDKQVINTGLDIIKNLFATTTDRLFFELQQIPNFDGSDVCYREHNRTFVSFFDHIKRWERFLRVRYHWWVSMHRIMSDGSIDDRFTQYFDSFRRFNKDASEICLAKGYVQTLCAHLDECSVDNLKSTVFDELFKHNDHHIHSTNLEVIGASIFDLGLIFNKLRNLTDIDEVADDRLKVYINEGLKIAIKEVYMRFLKLKLLYRRTLLILDARLHDINEDINVYSKWLKWAQSDELELSKMPAIETLEVEEKFYRKIDDKLKTLRTVTQKLWKADRAVKKCIDMLKDS
ncbi:unnamed protein product [Bursaphelenchus okinawaensis]|uniref:Uncharacterized protein n=1 Tax=Bursaphelenchus okinawaensis TaxID=465554 RepID=A0A811JQC0_9BILA|nr:unnamed protein product [Bursaphelenchus okinawaensis]CAG9077970.1 unnamed protein product [Bursaphelenchus okinawaensis]